MSREADDGIETAGGRRSFDAELAALFDAYFPRLFRVLDRLSGDADLAADLAQEAFVRLHARASLPDAPAAWLVSVALNLFRNARTTRSRRRRLLTVVRAEGAHADPPPQPDQGAVADDARRRVRAAVDRLPERERQLLLLRAEGYSYRELASALGLRESSVGTLLARAQRAFRTAYRGAGGGGESDAP